MEDAIKMGLFWLLAIITVVSALMFVTNTRIVHAVLYFFLTLMGLAGIFFFLDAPFIGAAQIMVYAGAITVLILFVVMLTMTSAPEIQLFRGSRVAGTVAAVVVGIVFTSVVLGAKWAAPAGKAAAATTTKALANALFVKFLLPFEIAAVLLLVALIAAIYLAVGGEAAGIEAGAAEEQTL